MIIVKIWTVNPHTYLFTFLFLYYILVLIKQNRRGKSRALISGLLPFYLISIPLSQKYTIVPNSFLYLVLVFLCISCHCKIIVPLSWRLKFQAMVTDKFFCSSLIPQIKWISYPTKINCYCYRNWNASDSLNRKHCVLCFSSYHLSNHILQNQFVSYNLPKEIATHYISLLWKSHGICVSLSHKNLINCGDTGMGNRVGMRG